ncbi:MAG: helix-turn-helix domain-containing protein [Armatimonadota bacterium]
MQYLKITNNRPIPEQPGDLSSEIGTTDGQSPAQVPTDTGSEQLPPWLTAEEAAAILRVHITTIHEMCRRGELPAMKAGRDWRISARGLEEKARLGDMHGRLIAETAELAARKAAQYVLEDLAGALNRELRHQQFDSYQRKIEEIG